MKNTSGLASQNSFFDQQQRLSTTQTGAYDRRQPDSRPISQEDEDNWDPNAYTEQDPYASQDEHPGVERRPTDILKTLGDPYAAHGPLDLHEDTVDDYWEDEDEDDETRFVNFSLLSHIAMQLRDKVPRGTHVKGSIPYPRAFTGKDIVVRWHVHHLYSTI